MRRVALLLLSAANAVAAPACVMPAARPPPNQRLFASPAVEAILSSLSPRFPDANLATLWSNALPNTLDTTVLLHSPAPPDSFVITGDIRASWLRDSANQVWPYLRFVKDDAALAALIAVRT